MPLIKSAIKKMRKDKVRTIKNKKREDDLKNTIKKARANASAENLTAAFSALDKAVKVKLIKKNKASRLKSRLAKSKGQVGSTTKKPAKKKITPKKK